MLSRDIFRESSNTNEQQEKDVSGKVTNIKTHLNDLGDWFTPLQSIECEHWIATGSSECQHINSDFSSSQRLFAKEIKQQYCRKSYFYYVHKPTHTLLERKWLCYSQSKEKLFCFLCKIMAAVIADLLPSFTEDAFND